MPKVKRLGENFDRLRAAAGDEGGGLIVGRGDTVRAYGAHVLVEFEPKPTHSEGGLHLPLSQQVEPHWARIVSVGHLVRERIPVGARALVKCWMNGQPLVGTKCHWLTEDDVLGVEER